MAIGTALFGPNDVMPNYTLGEWHWLHLIGDGTQVVVARGKGVLGRVVIGVAGTAAKFYDCVSGGTTDGTTQIVTVGTTAAGFVDIGAPFDDGLTVITTGASGDLWIGFRGIATVNAKTAGVGV